MKFGKTFFLGTILASCASAALATPTNYLFGELDASGTAQVTATQLIFGNLFGEKPKGATVGQGSDNFSNIGDNTAFLYNFTGVAAKAGPPAVSAVPPIFDFSSLASGPVELFSISDGTATVNFFLTEIDPGSIIPGHAKMGLIPATKGTFTGEGYVTEDGFINTPVDFSLTNNSTGTGIKAFSFSIVSVAPEPSSLTLLGSGIVSAVGMMFRRRRTL
jgi:PEP-CTERM motif